MMIKEPIIVTVEEGDIDLRLDVFLTKHIPDSTRSLVQNWLSQDAITVVSGRGKLKASGKVCIDTTYRIEIPTPIEADPLPVDMDLDIYYEDEHLLVLNKQAGLVVHPGAGHQNDTLVNGLLAHCKDLSGIGGVLRPGIVHRLDKETSGLMVVAKHDKIHHELSLQFQNKNLETGVLRKYIGFVWGRPNDVEGEIDLNIGRHPKNRQKMAVVEKGGKESLTHYERLQTYSSSKNGVVDKISKMAFTLSTGRTHQIRVHAAHIKFPLIGDPLYGHQRMSNHAKQWPEIVINFARQALHAYLLEFTHPISGERLHFEAPIPEDMRDLEESITVV